MFDVRHTGGTPGRRIPMSLLSWFTLPVKAASTAKNVEVAPDAWEEFLPRLARLERIHGVKADDDTGEVVPPIMRMSGQRPRGAK